MKKYIYDFTIVGEISIEAESLEEAETIVNRMTDDEIVEAASSTIADIDLKD